MTSLVSNVLNIFSIFKNEESLFSEFIPPELLHREEEIKQLAVNYRSVVRSENITQGNHVVIVGLEGIGKTVLVKHTVKLLNEISRSQIDFICLDCFTYKRAISILRNVLEYHYFLKSRGISFEEKAELVADLLKKRKSHLIICLRNADQIKENEILALSNIDNVSLVLTQKYTLNSEQLINSFNTIHLRNYTIQEFKEIINYRARLAFKQNRLSEEVIDTIISISTTNNVRHALRLFHQTGY